MEQRIIYIGLDVHKDTIAVALAEAGKRGELREYGKIANTPAALRTLAAKLASHGWRLRFCYEAGPCGYVSQLWSTLEDVSYSPHDGAAATVALHS